MIRSVVEVRHKIIKQEVQGTTNYTTYTLYSMVPAGGPIMQRMDANVVISVYPSNKVFIEDVTFGFGIIRHRFGILEGIKLMDQEAMKASIAKSAIRFLEKYLKRSLVMPSNTKFETHWGSRGCLKCRFIKYPRMGSDEAELDFEEEEGVRLRDMHGMDSPPITPELRCTLHNEWLEEKFDVLHELNSMAQAGNRSSSIVNLRIAYDSWPTERFRQHTPMTADPDDEWPREQHSEAIETDPTGEWANLSWYRRQLFRDRACQYHRWWGETIPYGWMPETSEGVLLPGGIPMRMV